jgi:hypothetical protein
MQRKFVICPFLDEETKGSYPFANGLNGLNGLAHLRQCGLHYLLYLWNLRCILNSVCSECSGFGLREKKIILHHKFMQSV